MHGSKFTDIRMLYIGQSVYRRGAAIDEAPRVVDCRTLIRWLFSLYGMSLPEDFLSWLSLGVPVGQTELKCLDIVFTNGYKNLFVEGVGSIGHVAIVTDLRDLSKHTSTITDRNVAASWGVLDHAELSQLNGRIRESFGADKRAEVFYAAQFPKLGSQR